MLSMLRHADPHRLKGSYDPWLAQLGQLSKVGVHPNRIGRHLLDRDATDLHNRATPRA